MQRVSLLPMTAVAEDGGWGDGWAQEYPEICPLQRYPSRVRNCCLSSGRHICAHSWSSKAQCSGCLSDIHSEQVKFITSMPKQLHLLTAHHGFHPVSGDAFIWVYAQICAIVYVCMWRPEGDLGCLPRHGLITETGTHQSVWLG